MYLSFLAGVSAGHGARCAVQKAAFVVTSLNHFELTNSISLLCVALSTHRCHLGCLEPSLSPPGFLRYLRRARHAASLLFRALQHPMVGVEMFLRVFFASTEYMMTFYQGNGAGILRMRMGCPTRGHSVQVRCRCPAEDWVDATEQLMSASL